MPRNRLSPAFRADAPLEQISPVARLSARSPQRTNNQQAAPATYPQKYRAAARRAVLPAGAAVHHGGVGDRTLLNTGTFSARRGPSSGSSRGLRRGGARTDELFTELNLQTGCGIPAPRPASPPSRSPTPPSYVAGRADESAAVPQFQAIWTRHDRHDGW